MAHYRHRRIVLARYRPHRCRVHLLRLPHRKRKYTMPFHRSSPLALLFLAAVACSSSGSNGGAGDSGSSGDDSGTGNPLAARAYVHSRLAAGAGPNASTICGITDPAWVDIGTNIMSTNDGDVDAVTGQTVHVSCSVTSNN